MEPGLKSEGTKGRVVEEQLPSRAKRGYRAPNRRHARPNDARKTSRHPAGRR